MGKIANWSEVNSKFGTTGSPTSKCPTKTELVNSKLEVSGGYSNNQTVQLSDITKRVAFTLTFTITTTLVGARFVGSTTGLSPTVTLKIVNNYTGTVNTESYSSYGDEAKVEGDDGAESTGYTATVIFPNVSGYSKSTSEGKSCTYTPN